jgi:hypothetical protein
MSLIVGIMSLIGAILSNFTIKAFARRPLFIVGAIIQGISLGLLVLFILKKNSNLCLVFMCTHLLAY